jgi:hypothetical protein
MRFRSLGCDGADEGAGQFEVPGGNAQRFDATFDCPDANVPRSKDEFSPGPSTL